MTFENPKFMAKDVAEWIEHSNVSVMLNNVDEEEKVEMPTLNSAYAGNLTSEVWFLTEDRLYKVIMLSR